MGSVAGSVSSDVLDPICFQWIARAAAVAEVMLQSNDYAITIGTFAAVEALTGRQRCAIPARLQAAVSELRLTIKIAELDGDYACYDRGGSGMAISTDVYLNKTMLRELHAAFMRAPDTEQQWIAFLAVKLLHVASNYLLTALDNDAARLIGVRKDGSRLDRIIFKDFGNLFERVVFGGILLLEHWPTIPIGENMLCSLNETWPTQLW